MKVAGIDGRVPRTRVPIVAVGAAFSLGCPEPPQPAITNAAISRSALGRKPRPRIGSRVAMTI
jgi:hypothetical protein